MKPIKRIPPPRFRSHYWNVRFRPCATGIAIDIELALYPGKGMPKGPAFFNLLRSSYLIPWEQIDSWSRAPRGKLISVKRKVKQS